MPDSPSEDEGEDEQTPKRKSWSSKDAEIRGVLGSLQKKELIKREAKKTMAPKNGSTSGKIEDHFCTFIFLYSTQLKIWMF